MTKKELFVKGICGKTLVISVSLCDWFTQIHNLDKPNVDIYDYAKSVNLCTLSGQRIDLSRSTNENLIKHTWYHFR